MTTTPIIMDDDLSIDDPSFPTEGTVLASYWPATEHGIVTMLDAGLTPEDGNDGRGPWMWLRLANGDLIFGCFPQGDLYFQLEEDGLR